MERHGAGRNVTGRKVLLYHKKILPCSADRPFTWLYFSHILVLFFPLIIYHDSGGRCQATLLSSRRTAVCSATNLGQHQLPHGGWERSLEPDRSRANPFSMKQPLRVLFSGPWGEPGVRFSPRVTCRGQSVPEENCCRRCPVTQGGIFAGASRHIQ